MAMDALLPSEIARMVYGYLLEERCTEAARLFLRESSNLEECRQVLSVGRHFSTRVCGLTLLDVLEKFCLLNTIVQEKLENFDKLDKLRHCSDLTSQIKVLFEEYKGRNFIPTVNTATQSTPSLQGSPKFRKRRIFCNKEDDKTKRNTQEITEESQDNSILDQSPNSVEATPLKNLPGYTGEFEAAKHKTLNPKIPEQNSFQSTPQKNTVSQNAHLQKVQKGHQNSQSQEIQKDEILIRQKCPNFNKEVNFQTENLIKYIDSEVQTEFNTVSVLDKNIMTETEQKTCTDIEVQTSDIGSPESEVQVAEILGEFSEKLLNRTEAVDKIVENINTELKPIKSNDDTKETYSKSFLADFNKAIEAAANKSENDPEIVDLINAIVIPPEQNLTENEVKLDGQCGASYSSSPEEINSISEETVSESSIEKDVVVINNNVNKHKILESKNSDKSRNTIDLKNSANIEINSRNQVFQQIDPRTLSIITNSTNVKQVDSYNSQIILSKENNMRHNTETLFNSLDTLHLQKNSTNNSENMFSHNNTTTSTPIKTFTAIENFDSCDWFSAQDLPTSNIAYYKDEVTKYVTTTASGYTSTEANVINTHFLSPIASKDTNKIVEKINCALANTVKDQTLHTPDIFFPPKINTAVSVNSNSCPMNIMDTAQKNKTPTLQKSSEIIDEMFDIQSSQKSDKNLDNLSSDLKDNNSNDCNKYFNVDSVMLYGVDSNISSIPMPMYVQEIEIEDSITLTGTGLSPFLKVIKKSDNTETDNVKQNEKVIDSETSNVLSAAFGNDRIENNISESKITENTKCTPTKVTENRPKTSRKSLSTPKKPNSYIRALNFDTPINRSQSENKVNNTDSCLSPDSLKRSLKNSCKSSLFQSPPLTNSEFVELKTNTNIFPTIPESMELAASESKTLKKDSSLPKKESTFKPVVTEQKSWDSELRKNLGKSEESSSSKKRSRSESSRKSSKKAKKSDRNTPKKEKKSYKKSSKKSKKDEKLNNDDKKKEELKTNKRNEDIKADKKKEEVTADKKKEDIKADRKKEEVTADKKKEDIKADRKKEEVKVDKKKEDIKVDKKKEEIKADKKKEEIKADKKKDDVKTDKKNEEIKSDKKKEDIKVEKQKENIKADKKKEDIKVEKQKENIKADKKKEDIKVDKKKDDVKTDKKNEEIKSDKKKEDIKVEKHKENFKADKKKEDIKVEKQKENIKADKKKEDIKGDKKKEDIKADKKKEDFKTDKKKEERKRDKKKDDNKYIKKDEIKANKNKNEIETEKKIEQNWNEEESSKIKINKNSIAPLGKESSKKEENKERREKSCESKSRVSKKKDEVKEVEEKKVFDLKDHAHEKIVQDEDVIEEIRMDNEAELFLTNNNEELKNSEETRIEIKSRNIDKMNSENSYSINNEKIEPVEPKLNNENSDDKNAKQKQDPLIALLSDNINDDNGDIQNIEKLASIEMDNLSKLNDKTINGLSNEHNDAENIQDDEMSKIFHKISNQLTARILSEDISAAIDDHTKEVSETPLEKKSSVDELEEQLSLITNAEDPKPESKSVIYDEVKTVERGKVVQKKYARLKTLNTKLVLRTTPFDDFAHDFEVPGKDDDSLQVPPTPQVLSPSSSSLILPLSKMSDDSRTFVSLISTPLKCPKTPNIVITPIKGQNENTSDVPQTTEICYQPAVHNSDSSKKPEITQFEVIKENLKPIVETSLKTEEDNLSKIQASMSYREKKDDIKSDNNENSSSSCSCTMCYSTSTSESTQKSEASSDDDDSDEEEEDDEDEEEEEKEEEDEESEEEIDKPDRKVIVTGETSPAKVFTINKTDEELAETVQETPAKDSSCPEVDIFDTPNVSKPVEQPTNLSTKISQMMILKDQENKVVHVRPKPKIISVKRVLPKVITKPPIKLIKALPKNIQLQAQEIKNELATLPPTNKRLKIEKSEEEVALAIKSIENHKFNKSIDEVILLSATPSPANKSIDKNISNRSELAQAIESLTRSETETIEKFGNNERAAGTDEDCNSDANFKLVLEDDCEKEDNSNGTGHEGNAQEDDSDSTLNNSHSHNTRFQSQQRRKEKENKNLGNCTQACQEIVIIFDETTYKKKRRKGFSDDDLCPMIADEEHMCILRPTQLETLLDIRPKRKKPVRRAQGKKEKCLKVDENSHDSVPSQMHSNDSELIPHGIANVVNDEANSKHKRPLEEGEPSNKQVVKKRKKDIFVY